MKRKRTRKPTTEMMDPKVLMDYDRWVKKHLDEMSRRYPHRYIGVYRNELIAVGDSYKEVYEAARAQGIKESPLVMQVPTEDDMNVIL